MVPFKRFLRGSFEEGEGRPDREPIRASRVSRSFSQLSSQEMAIDGIIIINPLYMTV